MAEIGNNTNVNTLKKKEYATDEAGMLRDAKDYASRDFKQTVEVFRKAGVKEEQVSDEIIAKTLTIIKLGHIKESRLNRVTYFD